MDEDESGELLGLLMQIAAPDGRAGSVAQTTLPLTSPAPDIMFEGKSFCFTGVFKFGTRSECHHAVITKKLDYLIIGSVGSEFWRHSSFGTNIMKAAQYKDDGSPIAIVAEAHWVGELL